MVPPVAGQGASGTACDGESRTGVPDVGRVWECSRCTRGPANAVLDITMSPPPVTETLPPAVPFLWACGGRGQGGALAILDCPAQLLARHRCPKNKEVRKEGGREGGLL